LPPGEDGSSKRLGRKEVKVTKRETYSPTLALTPTVALT